MIVEVKQEHIDNGVKGCPCYCAVSLAVYDALKDKYNFTDSEGLDYYGKEEVEVGESWVETSVCGSGAEISIYTKIRDVIDNKHPYYIVVEDYIAIEDEAPINSMNALALERWIEDFDTFDNSKPTSFVIEDIHRMNK